MEKAQIVIEYIKKLKGINLNDLCDRDFSQMSFLNSREAIIGINGERISKSYYYKNKVEAIRIVYNKIYGTFTHNGIEYQNEYLGVGKSIHWMRWDGTVAFSKDDQSQYFTLVPIDENDLSQGFTSLFKRKIARDEANNLMI